MNQPIQLKENKIVRYLLDNGGIDMNHLAREDFPREDREQFAQLIGYSLDGFGTLSYVSDEVYAAAYKMYEEDKDELQARVEYLEELVTGLKENLREPIAELFELHPTSLG